MDKMCRNSLLFSCILCLFWVSLLYVTTWLVYRPFSTRNLVIIDLPTQQGQHHNNLLTVSNIHLLEINHTIMDNINCDQTVFKSSQSYVALTLIQYSAIFLHGLCTNNTECPLSVQTCQSLDSLNLLRSPCLTRTPS